MLICIYYRNYVFSRIRTQTEQNQQAPPDPYQNIDAHTIPLSHHPAKTSGTPGSCLKWPGSPRLIRSYIRNPLSENKNPLWAKRTCRERSERKHRHRKVSEANLSRAQRAKHRHRKVSEANLSRTKWAKAETVRCMYKKRKSVSEASRFCERRQRQ